MASRIKHLLHKLDFLMSVRLSSLVSGFVDNQVMVQEVLHSFKVRKVKARQMAIKLDLQKAYDRVNWNFLKVGC